MPDRLKPSQIALAVVPAFLIVLVCLMAFRVIRPLFYKDNVRPYLQEIAQMGSLKFEKTCLAALPNFETIDSAANKTGMTQTPVAYKDRYFDHVETKAWSQKVELRGGIELVRTFNGTTRRPEPYRLSMNNADSRLNGQRISVTQCRLYVHNGFNHSDGIRRGSPHPAYVNMLGKYVLQKLHMMRADISILPPARYPLLHQDIMFRLDGNNYYLRITPFELILERSEN